MCNTIYLLSTQIDFKEGYYTQIVSDRCLGNVEHQHDFYEIVCVLSASCVQIINGERKNCDIKSITVISPEDQHFYESQEDGLLLVAISVKQEEILLFMKAYGINEFSLDESYSLSARDMQRLKNLCMQSLVSDNPLILKNALGIIFNSIAECKVTLEQKIPNAFVKVIEEMNTMENIKEGIPAFLRVSGYSHSQLCRLMKKWLNTTPKEYINKVRLEHAYTMIVSTNQCFGEIAVEVGFSSVSHFSDLIKKTYGFTPAELRKRYM